jgi:Fe-S cluster biogenesis protein NfuA
MSAALLAEDLQTRVQQADAWLETLAQRTDPASAAQFTDVLQTLLEFHAAGLRRISEIVADAGPAGRQIMRKLLDDSLVAGLLALHELHPRSLTERIHDALESVAPALAAHGGKVVLLDITEDNAIHLQLEGNCHGCPSSQATLTSTIHEAIFKAAPEVTAIHVDGAAPPPPAQTAFIPLEQLTRSAAEARAAVA